MGRGEMSVLDDVERAWPILSALGAGLWAIWRWVTARQAREETRLARIERDIQKHRAENLEHGFTIKKIERDTSVAWKRIDKLQDDVGDIREGVARIEGVLGTRNTS